MPIKIVQFTETALFKGPALIVLGLLALLYAYYMKKKWSEPMSIGFGVFIGLAAFIVLFGLFILLFQPQWWKLPY